jgi:hypothetical protein
MDQSAAPDSNEAEYEIALREWAALTEAGAKAALCNRQVDRRQRAYLRIKTTPGGRALISRLAVDHNPHVAGWAATDMLDWDPKTGREILTRLRDSGGPGSFESKITLMQFDKGELKLGWDPDDDRLGRPVTGDIGGH